MSRRVTLARKRLLQRGQIRTTDRGGNQKMKSLEMRLQRIPSNPEAALSEMMSAAHKPPHAETVHRLVERVR